MDPSYDDLCENHIIQLWQTILYRLIAIVQSDQSTEHSSQSTKQTTSPLFQHHADLYLQYLDGLKQLESLYNEMVHPQKREHVRSTQTLVIQRIIQLRNYLYHNPLWHSAGKATTSTLASWEFIDVNSDYFSGEKKFQWHTTQTTVPQFLRDDSKNEKETRDGLVKACIRRMKKCLDDDKNASIDVNDTDQSLLDQLRIGDLDIGDYSTSEMNYIQIDAAIVIQRNTRGYIARLQCERNALWVQMFIGMMENTFQCERRDKNKKRLADLDERRECEQRRNTVDYKDSLADLRDEVYRDEGFTIKQELREERIQWVTAHIAQTNEIPDSLEHFYESLASAGGSDQDTDKNDEAMRDEVLNSIKDDISKFKLLWLNTGTSSTKNNDYFSKNLAKDLVVRDQVRTEIQKSVDEELVTNLNRMIALDSGGGAKKSKKNTDSKKKKGKSGGKFKKGKKEKSLPGDKIAELKNLSRSDVVTRLVQYGMLDVPKEINLDDLLCSNETEVCTEYGETYHPVPTLSEVKRLVIEYAILPNGTRELKRGINKAHSIRSILLYGPKGNGKATIAQIVASELGALFIDLSPSKIPEEVLYEKKGPTKLLHTIFTFAKDEESAPVVIYMGDCEKYFQNTKKKKGKSVFASKFQKDLMIYKNQGIQNDRVIIIGSTSCPWEADLKQLKWKGESGKPEKQGFFERLIYVPNPGHIDRSLLWRGFVDKVKLEYPLKRTTSKRLSIDSELLARFSVGYSAGAIRECVSNTLQLDRIHDLDGKTLEEELITDLNRRQGLTSDDTFRTFSLQAHAPSVGGKKSNANKSKQKGKK